MRTIWSWTVRVLVAAACIFLTFRSAHIALADLRAQRNGLDGLDAAIRMEPGDSVLLARDALFRNSNDDLSPAEDQRLEHAADLDPLNADLPMALGLRAEFRGHPAEAERYLVHAAEIDHTFRPAWTLANFYFRSDQPAKSWPMIQRALNLNPLAFDPTPVFDLCWNETADSKKIAELLPTRGAMSAAYLRYLITKQKTDSAVEFWPHALEALNPADPLGVDAPLRIAEFLIQANRVPEATRIWNQVVDRRIIASGKLDPEAGVSIANPEFAFAPIERAFDWHVTHEGKVVSVVDRSAVRFEFDGNEPEYSLLLFTIAPLISAREYRLVWQVDASRLSSLQDPGFVLQVILEPGEIVNECQILNRRDNDGICRFTSRPDTTRAQINLIYRRAIGTARVQGTFQINALKLGFGS
jgi:tetratricopeptide (TPR) repeat protein